MSDRIFSNKNIFEFPICNTCKHLRRGTNKCKAFKDGIPEEILVNEANHKEPYPDDDGIQYEKIDDDT